MDAKIKQKIQFSLQSRSEQLGDIEVYRYLPNEFIIAIGPFVFIEHFLSCKQSQNGSKKAVADNCLNPCRGVATLTYILDGEAEHRDSIGNHIILNSGGVHWTNAGSGIIHHESLKPDFLAVSPNISVVRFWINLPSNLKSNEPDYLSFRSNEIPKKELEGISGWIKIISGVYADTTAKIPRYSNEFLYHIHLEAEKQFSITTDNDIEYAAFLPSDKADVNNTEFRQGRLIVFASHGEMIEISNKSDKAIDILLFGGESYLEPIESDGFFVMNTPHEVTQAYNDYYEGKYGQINP